jgi:hypothetical protein
VDWLQYTVDAPTDDDVAVDAVRARVDMLTGGPWLPARGRMGYGRADTGAGGATVLHHGRNDDMAVHVILPGAALDTARAQCPDTEHADAYIVREALAHPCKVTRIDIAYDDTTGAFGVAALALWHDLNLITCRATGEPQWQGRKHAGGGTFTLGARQSGAYLRVYDKAWEQAPRGPAQAAAAAKLSPWLRVEYELHRERANTVALQLADGDWRAVTAQLMQVACLREHGADTNRARWPVHPLWAALLGAPGTYAPSPAHEPGTIDEIAAWVEYAAAPALATLALAWEPAHCARWMDDIVRRAYLRLSGRHARALALVGVDLVEAVARLRDSGALTAPQEGE